MCRACQRSAQRQQWRSRRAPRAVAAPVQIAQESSLVQPRQTPQLASPLVPVQQPLASVSKQIGAAALSATDVNPWLIARQFISERERALLFSKALRHLQRGELLANPAGPGRFFAKVDEALHIFDEPLLDALAQRCAECLHAGKAARDAVLGRTISVILPGGFIHTHKDAYIDGMRGHRPGLNHLRCNLVVRLADPSGRPVIEGDALDVHEGSRAQYKI